MGRAEHQPRLIRVSPLPHVGKNRGHQKTSVFQNYFLATAEMKFAAGVSLYSLFIVRRSHKPTARNYGEAARPL